ncbi:hypothetical protein EVG20_g11499 [Dentipellis fragilis]|uniref:Tc1-like transposase DDE domain-containing protein n=1 Tax=Dentipellis fragilis TaxID=205917 RepID=A0A4Y9XPM5_9AGAM|nr:hypothetical protein EVG20_g11499 [Dentipellis fragilis]
MHRIGQYSPACLIFLDEVSKDERTYARLWGQDRVGTRVEQHAPFVWGCQLSTLAAMALDEGVIAARVVEDSFTMALFMDFLRNDLLPVTNPFPGPQSVLVCDNARIHHAPEVRELIESFGCRLEYLPPYSPDYNPIEQAFSIMKSQLRRNGSYMYPSDQLYYEMYAVCDVITPEMIWGFFSHSGLKDLKSKTDSEEAFSADAGQKKGGGARKRRDIECFNCKK